MIYALVFVRLSDKLAHSLCAPCVASLCPKSIRGLVLYRLVSEFPRKYTIHLRPVSVPSLYGVLYRLVLEFLREVHHPLEGNLPLSVGVEVSSKH